MLFVHEADHCERLHSGPFRARYHTLAEGSRLLTESSLSSTTIMLGRASFAARALPRNANTFKRFASSKSLKETLEAVIPIKQNQLKQLKATHGQTTVGDVKVEHIIGGMRGLKAMLWEASVLDPNEVRPYPLYIQNSQLTLHTGYTFPRTHDPRLSICLTSRTRRQGNHCGEYALASPHWRSSYSLTNSRALG